MMIQALLLLLSLFMPTSGHPQCNDFTPPIENPQGARYCNMYKDFTCCTQKMDDDIKKAVESVGEELRKDRSTCVPLLKQYACQECSPYAAHVFETEDRGSRRPMPGLCGPFCSDLYQKCKDAMKLLVKDDKTITSALSSESEFCNLAKINDKTYCYPDVIKNTDLTNQLKKPTSSSEGCVCFQVIDSGLKNPMFLLSSDSKRHSNVFYVGTQEGIIYTYENGKPSLFMDISDKTRLFIRRGDERGLLGMAIHSNFESTQKFYLFYIAHIGGFLLGDELIRISEFRTKPGNLKQGDPKSERIILEVEKTTSIHHGGALIFGHDGYLYVTLGDGGDPVNAQNKNTLLGSMLRLDVSTPNKYGIPRDNPFVGKDGKDEIYAYGLRNPYRASQDRGDPKTGAGRGRIFLADVGQYSWEEVNIIKKGGNYGWKKMEGQKCNEPPCGGMTPPIAVYSHEVGQANIGGFVYRGCDMPGYSGMYIYSDYQSRKLFRLKQVTSSRWERKEIDICGKDLCNNGLTNGFPILIMSIGEDYHGELYLLTSATASSSDRSGHILKIVDPRRRGSSGSCGGQPSPSPPTPPRPTTKRPSTTPRPPPTPEACGLNTRWRYRGTLTVPSPTGRKCRKCTCTNCSCKKLKKKNNGLLKKACKTNAEAREACCSMCKKL